MSRVHNWESEGIGFVRNGNRRHLVEVDLYDLVERHSHYNRVLRHKQTLPGPQWAKKKSGALRTVRVLRNDL